MLKNQAIEIYQRILDNFPDFESLDKVHFFMAHEYRELGHIDDMVKQYQIIIKQNKDSSYVPEAYLLLGDYFLNQLDLPLAERHYRAVLDYPQSQAVSIARYKLAWVHINNSDFKKAIQLLEESIESAPTEDLDVDTYRRVDIKYESLIDMAYSYTEAYKDNSPQEALSYFQKYSWSRPVYTAVLEKLAYRYFIKKKWNHAAVIYRHLSELQHSAEKLLDYTRNIFESVQAMNTFENADQDMTFIIKALKKQNNSVHIPRKEKEKNMTDYEVYARNIATHVHDKARKQMSVTDFKRAADAYKLYLNFFDKSPAYEEMEANYAEALYSSKQYLEAGRMYEKMASRMLQRDKEKEEILYSAATAYYNALKQKDDLNYYQVAFARGGLKTVGNLYANHFPGSHRVRDILFNVAWISYDEGKYDEAIAEFAKFIDKYPDSKAAKAAIHLALDAFNLKEDYEGLISFGQQVIKNRRIDDAALKSEISKIMQASESRIVSSVTVAAMDDWEQGKSSLVDIVEQKKYSGAGEQILNTLIVSSRDKGDLETLFSTGGTLISQYSASPHLEDTLGIMIDSSLKISQFRILADYLEEFVKKFPDHENAGEFLVQAAQIRKRLGQHDLSYKDYHKVLSRFQKNTAKKEEIIFAMTDNFEQMGKVKNAIAFLKKKRKDLTKAGKIKADALLSVYYFKKGNVTESSRYQKRAKKAYRNEYGKKDIQLRDLIAQSSYHALDKKNTEFMKIQLRSRLDDKIVAAKLKRLEQLEKGYLDITSYQSPEWVLKALYRAYEANNEFGRFLKEAPLPELSPAEAKQYLKIVNDKAKQYVDKADQYLKTLREFGHKWEITDPDLVKYFSSSENLRKVSFFSELHSLAKIGKEFLHDKELKNLHDVLMKHPEDINTLLSLSRAYFDRGDYGQSVLIAQKAINDIQGQKDLLKASMYNIIGLSQLHTVNDRAAKNAFKKALEIDPRNIGVKINLAGLYQHYGHHDKAKNMYESLPNMGLVENSKDLIHPKAKEFYDAYQNGS
jgi:tetratricopeptide (TPR) repeat protein